MIKQKLIKIEKNSRPPRKTQNLTPMFKWGQSMTQIFIKLKFAHRWDSPGCLDLWGQSFELTSDNQIKFKAIGIQGESYMRFSLDFPLLKKVKNGKFKMESVGTGMITLDKQEENKIWRVLIQRKFSQKHKLKGKIWWEMNRRYPNVENAWNAMIKKEEEMQDQVLF